MDKEHEQILLNVAHGAVRDAVNGQSLTVPSSDEAELVATCGCFVTLKNSGRLRGCIGQFISDRPLIELVSEMAVSAATKDPRFIADPVTPAELGSLDIEISVLSPLQKTGDPLSIELGKHGIYIKKGYRTGVFLPQVATEEGWSKEEFLSYCSSHKAGLPPDAWKDPDTEVFTFTAEVFGEKEE